MFRVGYWEPAVLMPQRRSVASVEFEQEKPMRHDPVMVEEILDLLPLKPGAVVVDGTLGLAGHSMRFIEQIAPGGTLIGFDWDRQMLDEAGERLGQPSGVKLFLQHAPFWSIGDVLSDMGLKADGILLDLGLNSAQIEDPERGLSFLHQGPLDMRMDRSRGEPAAAMLNRMSPKEIEDILWNLGDERWARAISKKIVERRKIAPLRTTQELVECILAAVPVKARDKRIHPATRTFQAVRIAVNGELAGLEEALRDAADALSLDGVMVALSYHSGEDRIVKNVFRELNGQGWEDLYKKPVLPGPEEILKNPRSRSAKLRALKRVQV